MDRNEFDRLSAAGRSAIREYCQLYGKGDAAAGAGFLSKAAGCDLRRLCDFLNDTSVLLTGTEWEQLLYVCMDEPASLLYRAGVEPDAIEFAPAPNAPGPRPGKNDLWVRRILTALTSFYQEASTLFLQAHPQ